MMKIKNPWYSQHWGTGNKFYSLGDNPKPIKKYKNGAIYKLFDKAYLYVINGNAQTERAGASLNVLKAFVDSGANGFESHEKNYEAIKGVTT